MDGVSRVDFDLNTGQGHVTMKPDTIVNPAKLWRALVNSGFTPVRIKTKGQTYAGPKP